MSPAPPFMPGHLDPFFETGTEGVVWSLIRLGVPGYDALVPLADGDLLQVRAPAQSPASLTWEGTVCFEYERCRRPYPTNPSLGQQAVRGMWVNGLQQGVDPDTWAGYFFDRCPAQVVQVAPDQWGRCMAELGLAGALPHEQTRGLLEHSGSALLHATQQRIRQSLGNSLVFSVQQALGWSPRHLVEWLDLPAEDAALLLGSSQYSIDLSGWSPASMRQGLGLLAALDYIRFQCGAEMTWQDCPALMALRTTPRFELEALLEQWAPRLPA